MPPVARIVGLGYTPCAPPPGALNAQFTGQAHTVQGGFFTVVMRLWRGTRTAEEWVETIVQMNGHPERATTWYRWGLR